MKRQLLVIPALVLAALSSAQKVTSYVDTAINEFNPPNSLTDGSSFTNDTASTWNNLAALSANVGSGGVLAEAYSAGKMGTLKAKALSSYPRTANQNYATAHAHVYTLDYLNVGSSSLAVGTPVTIQLQMVLSGTFSTPTFEMGGVYSADASAAIYGDSSVDGKFARYTNTGSVQPYNLMFTLNTKVGDSVTLQAELDASTYVSGLASVSRTASVDFASTARVFAWSNQSGVTLTSASGYNYSPVPEPVSVVALGMGLIGVCRRKRRSA